MTDKNLILIFLILKAIKSDPFLNKFIF